MRQLDRGRPYDVVCGWGENHKYEQDGIRFDHHGVALDAEDIPYETMRKKEVVVQPIQEIKVPEVPEVDEDVTLEDLHIKLDALGIKYHHRAGISTLQKLLDAAEGRKIR